jgi:hypothetical protein
MSASLNSGGFSELLGDARGITDARALRELLSTAERELDQARAGTRSSQRKLSLFRRIVARHGDQLRASAAALDDAHLEVARLRLELDSARYATMFAGARDPVIAEEEVHHGQWTPGRPYLDGQHVTHPAGGECFRAPTGGVRAGRMPGSAAEWGHCDAHRLPEARAPFR